MNLKSITGDIINSMEQNTEQNSVQRAKQGEPAVKIVLLRGGDYDNCLLWSYLLSICAGKRPNFVQILKIIVNFWPAERYYYKKDQNVKIKVQNY